MSATCNGCGDCCEKIRTSSHDLQNTHEWIRWYASVTRRAGDSTYWYMLEAAAAGGVKSWLDHPNYTFTAEHWHLHSPPAEAAYYTCDQFDAVGRRCLVHGTPEKPPVCTGFPWYGGMPETERLLPYRRCSFWEDIGTRLLPAFSV